MPAYYRSTLNKFLTESEETIFAALNYGYAHDGFFQLLSSQIQAWQDSLPIIKESLDAIRNAEPAATNWGILLEYPLYRLRKRIDLVLIAHDLVIAIEFKVGAASVAKADLRQVEEYALDLRDFHQASHGRKILPVLCCTDLHDEQIRLPAFAGPQPTVSIATRLSLPSKILDLYRTCSNETDIQINPSEWDGSSYEPVPTIIEAATAIFAGHNVGDISKADAENLKECSEEVLALVSEAKAEGLKRLIIVTGVPGAGKTLAGLHVTHGNADTAEDEGKVVYLSGNTPLVTVIREALAQDEKARAQSRGERRTLKEIRHDLQTRIQHINDFLQEYMKHDLALPPHENAIVFDEAQRAWDHKQGLKKFNRDASEPQLLLEIMGRNQDWAVIVGLIGAGQEINNGEAGLSEWGEAVGRGNGWEVIAPSCAIEGSRETADTALFPNGRPLNVAIATNERLRLTVPMRSYRSEAVSNWVNAVLLGEVERAAKLSEQLQNYPITLTRSLDECRSWLKEQTRGCRRSGLLASTSASRLLAEGLGTTLNVQDKDKVCHWYLQPVDDYRSSNSLEVTANEYTCQGLELDYAGICWGGDFLRKRNGKDWTIRKLRSTKWNRVKKPDMRRFITNKYRVFLTRAREGMVLFVPVGDLADKTRPPEL